MNNISQDKTLDSPSKSHILLDFFGTIVDYSPSRTEQGYEKSYDFLVSMGSNITYKQYLDYLNDVFSVFDKQSALGYSEFSMDDFTQTFLRRVLGRKSSKQQSLIFLQTYMSEWNAAVSYPTWANSVISDLSDIYSLAVVTNTHYACLVPNHLKTMGLSRKIDAVITSVEHGYSKPHPSIYEAALDLLNIEAENAIFVGDSYAPDYIGPIKAGMSAYLIDPQRKYDIPEYHRLDSLADLPKKLNI